MLAAAGDDETKPSDGLPAHDGGNAVGAGSKWGSAGTPMVLTGPAGILKTISRSCRRCSNELIVRRLRIQTANRLTCFLPMYGVVL